MKQKNVEVEASMETREAKLQGKQQEELKQ
jgi:hypothetical protein